MVFNQCDKGEPCAGCQPSHARLWQVPCTRIDIKEIGYFMKDWKADYERHMSLGFSVGNIKGFSDHERTLFITHGYGQVLPINAREVYVRDEQCFSVDWVESMHREPTQYEVETAKLSAGMEGISHALLSDYLDRHIDGNGTFEKFVDDYFEGTPFLTQMLKTAFRYYFRTKLPVIRKALKLVVAYNLTLHVTMVEGLGDEEGLSGKINSGSKFSGKTMAPVMINFQIKCAMANMWRELQKDVLEELSGLYSSVYSGDKLKNWPTIFILASILLAVWEEMQFDSHYRTPVSHGNTRPSIVVILTQYDRMLPPWISSAPIWRPPRLGLSSASSRPSRRSCPPSPIGRRRSTIICSIPIPTSATR